MKISAFLCTTIILLLSLQPALQAQNRIQKHFDYLLDDKESTHLTISGKMFEMINKMDIDEGDDEEIREVATFIKSIKSIELVASESMTDATSHFRKGQKILDSEMEELMRVTAKDGNFCLYIEEYDGRVSEVVGIGSGDTEFVVFSILGDMALQDIGKIANQVNMGHLEKTNLEDVNISEVKLYPNPISSTSQLTVSLPDNLIDGVGSIYDSNGSIIRTVKLGSAENTVKVSDLTGGKYVFVIENNGVSIRKRFIVIE